MKIVEVIRSLEYGGAQQAMLNRLRSKAASQVSTIVMNTLPSRNEMTEVIAAHCDGVVDLRMANIWLASGPQGAWGSRPDALVVHSPSLAIPLKVARRAHVLGVPVIEVVHNTRYARRSVTLLSKWSNSGADALIAVSEGVLGSRIVAGAPHAIAIPNGVPVQAMREWRRSSEAWVNQFRSNLNLPPGTALVMCCGRLEPQKRQVDLLRAVARVDLPIHLVLIGEGLLRARLERETVALGIVDRVTFLGARPDAWRYLAAADVVALPSSYEGLGVVLLEAQVLGRPVLASDIAGIRSVVTTRVNGLLHRPCDSDAIAAGLIELVGQPSWARELAQAGSDTAEHWDVESLSHQFYSQVESLIAAGAAA